MSFQVAELIEDKIDYAKIIFCGHGYYDDTKRSTFIELRKNEEIDSSLFRKGAPRQTVILDCCRVIEKHFAKIVEATAFLTESAGIPKDCRAVYEERINACPKSLVVLYACDIDKTSGDDSRNGGYYSYHLLSEATKWSHSYMPMPSILSVVDAHHMAVPQVQHVSGGRQNPQIEKPRSEPYFPFAVVA